MEVAPGEWNALLARLGLTDVYLTREYVESSCLLEPGAPVLLAHDDAVFPLILRAVDGRHDVVTPYGYGGPVAGDPDAAPGFYDAYAEWCRDRGVVSTFVRFHPLYENQRYSRFDADAVGATVAAEARREGELLAAVLCFDSAPWLHYHLGAQSDEGRRLGGSQLALLAAAQWGREGGYELLHLGGGVGGRRDSLFEFKQRFDPGAGERAFFVGKAIHDRDAYRELAGTDSLDGFFPAYRDTSRR